MRRIYVASSWRNEHQQGVVALLRAMGHEVYDFKHPRQGENGFHWSAIDPAWKAWTPAAFRTALSHRLAVGGFRDDFGAMEWADTGVLVLPCGRSAHLEAGYFTGAGKEWFLLCCDEQEPELMYRMATGICLDLAELARRLAPAQSAEESADMLVATGQG